MIFNLYESGTYIEPCDSHCSNHVCETCEEFENFHFKKMV